MLDAGQPAFSIIQGARMRAPRRGRHSESFSIAAILLGILPGCAIALVPWGEGVGMSDGFLPGWVGDLADSLSILSVPITFYLGYQAKTLKRYFFNRVRVGEILPEMSQEASELLKALRDWDTDSGRSTRLIVSRIKGRLINLKQKLGGEERKSVAQLLTKIENRQFYIFARGIKEMDKDSAWDIATEYASIISQVTGGHKDSGWRQ